MSFGFFVPVETKIDVECEFKASVIYKGGQLRSWTDYVPAAVTDNAFLRLLNVNSENVWAPNELSVDLDNPTALHLFECCLVGSGAKPPRDSDASMDSLSASSLDCKGGEILYITDWPKRNNHPGFVRIGCSTVFVFRGLKSEEIREVGVSSQIDDSRYALMARASFADAVRVGEGDVLEVECRFNLYVPLERTLGEFKDESTGDVYEYACIPHDIYSDELGYGFEIAGGDNFPLKICVDKDEPILPSSFGVGTDAWKEIEKLAFARLTSSPIHTKRSGSHVDAEEEEIDVDDKSMSRVLKISLDPDGLTGAARAIDIGLHSCGESSPIVSNLVIVGRKSDGAMFPARKNGEFVLRQSIVFSRKRPFAESE